MRGSFCPTLACWLLGDWIFQHGLVKSIEVKHKRAHFDFPRTLILSFSAVSVGFTVSTQTTFVGEKCRRWFYLNEWEEHFFLSSSFLNGLISALPFSVSVRGTQQKWSLLLFLIVFVCCWAWIYGTKPDMGVRAFFSSMLEWLWEFLSDPLYIKRESRWAVQFSLGFYTVVSFEVAQCRNRGDTAWGARKTRAQGRASPKATEGCDDGAYQKSAGLFNAQHDALSVLGRAELSAAMAGAKPLQGQHEWLRRWWCCAGFVEAELVVDGDR